MAISTAEAARTFVHYIRLALDSAGRPFTADMQTELNAAVDAFEVSDRATARAALPQDKRHD